MMKPLIVATLLLAYALATHATPIYRCDVNGRATFQDSPCGEDASRVEGSPLTTYQPPAAHQRPLRAIPRETASSRQTRKPRKSRQSSLQRHNQRVEARRKGILAVGMSEAVAIQILGHPDNFQNERHVSDRCKQYYWRNPRFSPGLHRAAICDGEVARYSGPAR
ncbi:DUF4124 domain-containing protein [Halomonas urumqiensis]|uniref:DUF4124 domain-containing protein n=1 Tax=Halomonas urumqiensis TaxID=1684789 RepID=A0A2N7UMU5_9GAMM|nr:DUF4124 domain-containing protein [Halomonas urumqiensis]PMR81741.1 hypothetical protein C1H70_04960 [Halomonas urumqiensis]PTB02378.1 DUF4124 domain-containing protein [Halomonas urumqiensis]GHE21861.1 hypothetical protein GCM10017767_23820 [Halomonas urumqiensis]